MYTTDLYSFVNTNFNKDEHIFITGKAYDDSKVSPIGLNRKPGDVKIIAPKNIYQYIKALNRADAIILHGFFSFKHVALISRKKEWLKKTCWVIWGGDIYQHNKVKRKLVDKITEKVKIRYAPEFGFIAPLVEKDLPLAKEWYHVTGQVHYVSYPVPLQRPGVLDGILQTGLQKNKNKNDEINILIGNSATETNCHFEALDLLSQYKDENIKLYIPLSYGFSGYEKYAEKVTEYASKIFGRNKIVPILDKMDGTAYTELLSKMDVAVFYNNRQQAMGNIAILIAAGAKVFIRDDTSMWGHYIQRGYHLENAFDIVQDSYEQFLTYEPKRKENNMAMIKSYLDISIVKTKWEKLFIAMKG